MARPAATTLTDEDAQDDDDTLAVQLLKDCRETFGERKLTRTTELLAELKTDPEAPWATHGPTGLTARTLAGILKEFGIRSGTYRMPGGPAKGYAANDFLDAWTRYLPASGADVGATVEEGSGPRSKRSSGNTPGHSLRLVTDATDGAGSSSALDGSAKPAGGEHNA